MVALVVRKKNNDDEVPSSTIRAELLIAGLGEKHISLFYYGSADEMYEELVNIYPKLASGGGYELLRQGAGRQLDAIPIPPGGYTVEYIKSIVHSAKVYIRPVQMSLDMTTPCDVSIYICSLF